MEFVSEDSSENGNYVVSRGLSGDVQKSMTSPPDAVRSIALLRPRTPLLDTEREVAAPDSGKDELSSEKFAIKRASDHFDDDGSPGLDSSRQKVEYSREGFDYITGGYNSNLSREDQNLVMKEDGGAESAIDITLGNSSVLDIGGENEDEEEQETGVEVDSSQAALGEPGTEEDNVDQGQGQGQGAPANEETEDERVARELAESETLAWQMMQQEADNAYHMQLEYMRNNQDNMSAEDYAALTQIVQEGAVQQAVAPPSNDNDQGVEDNEEANEGDDSADSSAAWEDPNNYDRLLALGSHIGDVKTERWRLRCKDVIAKQPRVHFRDILALLDKGNSSLIDNINIISGGDGAASAATTQESLPSPRSSQSADSEGVFTWASSQEKEKEKEKGKEKEKEKERKEVKETNLVRILCADGDNKRLQRFCERVLDRRCAVCMDSFESTCLPCRDDNSSTDEDAADDQNLILLPCNHYFHEDCCAGWMKDNNSCPICKLEVESGEATSSSSSPQASDSPTY